VTFGVIEKDEPLLAELIALAFESAGHHCLVFQGVDHASRVLHAIHVDAIVLDLHMAGGNGLDWLESMAATRPDFASRTLLLTEAPLTNDEAARIEKLGAEVVYRPFSLVGVELIVMGRLQKARSELGEQVRLAEREIPMGPLH